LCKFEPDGSRIDKFELGRSRIDKFELDGSRIDKFELDGSRIPASLLPRLNEDKKKRIFIDGFR